MKEITPLVSIIVPTNKRIEYLKKCIESIIQQTYTNFEVLIISDGQDTDTQKTVLEYQTDKRIFFYQYTKTSLPAAIRNFGLSHAKGQYIAFCDDDDFWDKDKLKKQILFCIKENAQICFTLSEKINAEGSVIKVSQYAQFRSYIDRFLYRLDCYFPFRNFVVLSSLIIRADVIQKFNEAIELRGSEDYELLLRLYKQSKVFFLKEKLVFYRIHNDNLSGDTFSAYKRCIKILEEKIIVKEYGFLTTYLARLTYKIRLFSIGFSKQKNKS